MRDPALTPAERKLLGRLDDGGVLLSHECHLYGKSASLSA